MKLLIVCLFLGIAASTANADCTLPLPRFALFAPLIFSPEGDLLQTNGFNERALNITLLDDEEVVLSCAPNYFKKTTYNKTKTKNAKCKSGEILDVEGVDANWIKDLMCEARPVEETVKPVSGCPAEATSVEFGYENPVKTGTILIGEACYSTTEGRTLFVHTAFVKNGNKKNAIIGSGASNYLAKNHPVSRYKIDFFMATQFDELNERLEKLLDTKKIPFLEHRDFIDLETLQNGQLSSTLKLGWNFVVVNGYDHLPNYDLLLKDILNLGEKNVDVYFGTHSTLSMSSENRDLVDLYLLPNEQKYPVPKYLWVVVTTDSGKGAGFLISNDIGATAESLTENAPCESQCSTMSWLTHLSLGDAYENPKDGLVLCCELDSFLKSVPEMPAIEGHFDLLTSNSVAPVRLHKYDVEQF